jgi:hypothetical protein
VSGNLQGVGCEWESAGGGDRGPFMNKSKSISNIRKRLI